MLNFCIYLASFIIVMGVATPDSETVKSSFTDDEILRTEFIAGELFAMGEDPNDYVIETLVIEHNGMYMVHAEDAEGGYSFRWDIETGEFIEVAASIGNCYNIFPTYTCKNKYPCGPGNSGGSCGYYCRNDYGNLCYVACFPCGSVPGGDGCEEGPCEEPD